MGLTEKQLKQINETGTTRDGEDIRKVNLEDTPLENTPIEIYKGKMPTSAVWVFDGEEQIEYISKVGKGERKAVSDAISHAESFAKGAEYIDK